MLSRRKLLIAGAVVSLLFGVANMNAQSVIATVPVGTGPSHIAVNPVTNKIYVLTLNAVAVIDGDNNTVATVPVDSYPTDLAVNTKTNKIYVVNFNMGSLTVINGSDNSATKTALHASPTAVAVNSVTNTVFITNSSVSNPNLLVLDGNSLQATPVTVGASPNAVGVDESRNVIYVVNSCGSVVNNVCIGNGTVSVVDGWTLATQSVQVGEYPAHIAVNPKANKIFVTNSGLTGVGNTATVIDGATLSTTTVTTGQGPWGLAVDTVTNMAYVQNQRDPVLTVINGANLGTDSIALCCNTLRIALNETTDKIYLTSNDAQQVGYLHMIDGFTKAQSKVQLGTRSLDVAVNQVTNRVYVGNGDDGTVSVLAGGDPTLFTLIVQKAGTGSGTVNSSDGNIHCGTVCSYDYIAGANVTLTGTPGPGSTFSNWGGCDSTQGNVCQVQMANVRNVTATFNLTNVSLTSLTLNPSTVKGGNISIATITLSAPAPIGGMGIGVISDHPSVAQPPSLVTVPAGRTSISFAVRTFPVRSQTMVAIKAAANNSQVSATLTVKPTY